MLVHSTGLPRNASDAKMSCGSSRLRSGAPRTHSTSSAATSGCRVGTLVLTRTNGTPSATTASASAFTNPSSGRSSVGSESTRIIAAM